MSARQWKRRRLLGTTLALALGAGAAAGAGGADTTPAPAAGPTVLSGPIVIGTASAGKRLTGLSGVWTGTGGIVYRFQWDRCNAAGAQCSSIGGATSPTYTLVSRDVGKTLGLTVEATDSTGTAAAYSSLVGPIAATRPPLESTIQPAVSGAPVIGRVLAASSGTWSPMVDTFTYRWERCNPNGRACSPIPGAIRSTYTVRSVDRGHALAALVQAINAATLQDTFSTATSAVVPPSVHGPIELSSPRVTGSAVSGAQLIAATGRWKGTGAVSFAFQWYRCDLLGSHCSAVTGATGATYRLGARDSDATIGLTLHIADLTGRKVVYVSLVGPVAAAGSTLSASAAPTLSGSARLASTLTVAPGSWSLAPTAYTYQWLSCNPNGRICSPIQGATSTSYTVGTADTGHTLVAEVQASAGTDTQLVYSAASSPVG